MPEIRGVLFDLDGTLVDSEWLHVAAWREIADKYKLEVSGDWDVDYVGKTDVYQAEKMLVQFPHLPPVRELLIERHNNYQRLLRENCHKIRFPGVEEGLKQLRADGFKLAVGTNSPIGNTTTALEAGGIETYFNALVAFGMVPNGKPAPDIYLEAARRIDVEPAACVVVEDTEVGLMAGKAAGCFTIGVATSRNFKDLAIADKLFNTTKEAIDWIRISAGCDIKTA